MDKAEGITEDASAHRTGDGSPEEATGSHPALHLLVSMLLDVGAPIAIYYWLRSAGTSELTALIAGSVPPVLNSLYNLVRRGRVDRLGLFVLVMLALTALVSVTTDSPRLLLLRDGWLTGAAGVAFLLTVPGRRPLAFTFSRPLLERQFLAKGGSWDTLWDNDAQFRRIWRVSTVIWGVGLLLDSGVRTAMAYLLPVDVVPALNGIQYGVFSLLMLLIVNIHQTRSGLWWIASGRPDDPPS